MLPGINISCLNAAKSAMTEAVKNGRVDIVKKLLDVLKSSKDDEMFHNHLAALCIDHNRVDVLTLLMRSGAGSPNSSHAGKIHLHRAIQDGKVDMMDALISLGADVKQLAPYGKTTLHLAASTGGGDVIARLLDLGCDVNAKDTIQGSTPLHVACAYCNRAAVLTLLSRGAEFNAVNHYRQTPLSKLLEPVTKADDFHNKSRLTLARELVRFGLILPLELMDRDVPEHHGACPETLHTLTGTNQRKPCRSSRRQPSCKLTLIYQRLIRDLACSLSLKQWCRLAVLKSVGHRPLTDSIKQLKVPTLVQTFILQGHHDLSGLRP